MNDNVISEHHGFVFLV